MPTILCSNGFRVYFWNHEPGEPPHVLVDRAGATAKVWLDPAAIASSAGFAARELSEVLRLVQSQQKPFLESWDAFFHGSTRR